jgi:hypothetical protein
MSSSVVLGTARRCIGDASIASAGGGVQDHSHSAQAGLEGAGRISGRYRGPGGDTGGSRARGEGRQGGRAPGLHDSYLAEIETGKKPGSAAALRKLSRVLAIPMENLVSHPGR